MRKEKMKLFKRKKEEKIDAVRAWNISRQVLVTMAGLTPHEVDVLLPHEAMSSEGLKKEFIEKRRECLLKRVDKHALHFYLQPEWHDRGGSVIFRDECPLCAKLFRDEGSDEACNIIRNAIRNNELMMQLYLQGDGKDGKKVYGEVLDTSRDRR